MTKRGFGQGPVPGRPESEKPESQQRPPARLARLELANGPAIGRSFPLQREKNVIGRNDPPALTVEIDLTDAELGATPVVSRRHAEISWVEDGLYLVDLGSTNGTLLNGEEITRRSGSTPPPARQLADGDRILVANVELVLRLGQD